MGARGRGSYHFFDEAAGPYYGSQPQNSHSLISRTHLDTVRLVSASRWWLSTASSPSARNPFRVPLFGGTVPLVTWKVKSQETCFPKGWLHLLVAFLSFTRCGIRLLVDVM